LWAIVALHPLTLLSAIGLTGGHLAWALVLHVDALVTVVAALHLARRRGTRPRVTPRPLFDGWAPALDGFRAELDVPHRFPENRAGDRNLPLHIGTLTMLLLIATLRTVPSPAFLFEEGPLWRLFTSALASLLYAMLLHVLADWDWSRPRAILGQTVDVELTGDVLTVDGDAVVLGDAPHIRLDPAYDRLHVHGTDGGVLAIEGAPAELVWLRDRILEAGTGRGRAGAVPDSLNTLRSDPQ
jgi:hypothetical protein